MNQVSDKLRFSFNINRSRAFDSIIMRPILELFDNFLPIKPEYIIRSNRPQLKITEYNCEVVLEALDKHQDVVQVFDEKKKISLNIMQEVGGDSVLGLRIESDLITENDFTGLKKLFIEISQMTSANYANCHFAKNRDELHNQTYKQMSRRTFFASGLYWLNFFGPEEEAKQGGKALEINPYATEIKRLTNGLFIQVGETPFECYTDTGREQLINATKAMPPATGW
jgi:hypothetical protein